MTENNCISCGSKLTHTFVDLGMAPMVSTYLELSETATSERFFPLHAYTCENCFHVQLPLAESPENIFGDYPYFSSMSKSWLKHCEAYAQSTFSRFNLSSDSHVVEIASNDGYMLQYFKGLGTQVLGVEPARNIAEVANEKGIKTISEFFGTDVATKIATEQKADLIIGNNVLAHVPKINDFVSGIAVLLADQGIVSVEFPHLLKTVEENQFDQVFHEHFSYLSLNVVSGIFEKHGLQVFDVKELPTHGGSIRVYAQSLRTGEQPIDANVQNVIEKELAAGLCDTQQLGEFSKKAVKVKHDLLTTLITLKNSGKSIVGYGAPGKGCILLNYCGIRQDILDYLVDISPVKQNKKMPGVHLPIYHPDEIAKTKPDYVLILPWNLSAEIMEQMAEIRSWGGKFIIPIPEVSIV